MSEQRVLKVVHAVPTEVVSEKLSVQRIADIAGAEKLRGNVWTLDEGSQLRHAHREQEELYLVLDGTAQMEVDETTYRLGERDAIVVPAGSAHQLSNIGLGPLTYLVVAAPAVADDVICDWRDAYPQRQAAWHGRRNVGMLTDGEKAPRVVGTSYDGTTYDLGVPGKRTALWFYPKANTGGWTTEAVEFNGLLADFAALGIHVIGASVDKPTANRKFAEKHGLRMPLISDTDYSVATAFGVARPMVGVAKRTTFLIEPDGTLRKVYTGVKAKGHAAKVLEDCRAIWGVG